MHDFDLHLGLPDPHRVKPKIACTERRSLIPADLFEKLSKMAFWTNFSSSAANMITPKYLKEATA